MGTTQTVKEFFYIYMNSILAHCLFQLLPPGLKKTWGKPWQSHVINVLLSYWGSNAFAMDVSTQLGAIVQGQAICKLD